MSSFSNEINPGKREGFSWAEDRCIVYPEGCAAQGGEFEPGCLLLESCSVLPALFCRNMNKDSRAPVNMTAMSWSTPGANYQPAQRFYSCSAIAQTEPTFMTVNAGIHSKKRKKNGSLRAKMTQAVAQCSDSRVGFIWRALTKVVSSELHLPIFVL